MSLQTSVASSPSPLEATSAAASMTKSAPVLFLTKLPEKKINS